MYRAIQIENQPRPVIRQVNELPQQSIIEPVQLFPEFRRSLQQKSP
jgi:hypothetical protein